MKSRGELSALGMTNEELNAHEKNGGDYSPEEVSSHKRAQTIKNEAAEANKTVFNTYIRLTNTDPVAAEQFKQNMVENGTWNSKFGSSAAKDVKPRQLTRKEQLESAKALKEAHASNLKALTESLAKQPEIDAATKEYNAAHKNYINLLTPSVEVPQPQGGIPLRSAENPSGSVPKDANGVYHPSSPEDASLLPHGAIFIDPDGQRRVAR